MEKAISRASLQDFTSSFRKTTPNHSCRQDSFSAKGLKSKMVLQIHDELVFDTIPEEVDTLGHIVVKNMENVVKLSVPLTVECNYGANWLEAH